MAQGTYTSLFGFDPQRTLVGRFGTIWKDGKWLSNFNECEGRIDLDEADVPLTGELWTGTKITGLRGVLRIRGYKVNDALLAEVAKPMQVGLTPRLTIASALVDPGAFGGRRITYLNCQPSQNIPLDNFQPNNEPVMEEWNFRFWGFEMEGTFPSEWTNPINGTWQEGS